MGSSTSKKVQVTRFDREPVAGFVNTNVWLQNEGIELLTTGGSLVQIPYVDVKAVCFVKDFEGDELFPPPGSARRLFQTRPYRRALTNCVTDRGQA